MVEKCYFSYCHKMLKLTSPFPDLRIPWFVGGWSSGGVDLKGSPWGEKQLYFGILLNRLDPPSPLVSLASFQAGKSSSTSLDLGQTPLFFGKCPNLSGVLGAERPGVAGVRWLRAGQRQGDLALWKQQEREDHICHQDVMKYCHHLRNKTEEMLQPSLPQRCEEILPTSLPHNYE